MMPGYRIFGPPIVIAASLVLFAASVTRAQDITSPPAVAEPSSVAEAAPVTVGIEGIYRPGQWTLVRPASRAAVSVAVRTTDGDNTGVIYRQLAGSKFLYAVPGMSSSPMLLIDAEDNVTYRGRFGGRAIESKMPWCVVFGDPLGIEEIGRNELLGRDPTVAVSRITDPESFPDDVLGLSGVDLIVIGPSGIGALSMLSPSQGNAIANWVSRGGRLLVSLGKKAGDLINAAPWLKPLLPPGIAYEKTFRLDSSAIEQFTSSQNRLPVLDSVELPARGGQTIITGRNQSRQPYRIVVQSPVGFGRVLVAAFALDSAEITDWPQRTLLVSRMLGDNIFATQAESRREVRTASVAGYSDIAGQIRTSLDRFELRPRIPFSVISLVLVTLVALVGPLDYLVVNRVLGRPLLGWISFPLSVALMAAILLVIGRPSSGDASAGDPRPHVNRTEIVDIDLTGASPIGRGWSWAHLYSLDAAKTDYPATLDPRLLSDVSASATTSTPFGYPGTTFGGISIAGQDTRMPTYEVQLLGGENGIATRIDGIPLPPGGSKGIVSQWSFAPRLSGASDLTRRRGSELIQGRLTNPLDVDVLNGALVYGEWVYLLPTRFRAGETIPDINALRQKNFRWLLARREALENSSRSDPWNPEMYDDLGRLTEILMFNTIAGGPEYTGLENRPLHELDLSYLLTTDRAMLFGRLGDPALRIDLPVHRESVSSIRLLFPVAPPRLSTNGGS